MITIGGQIVAPDLTPVVSTPVEIELVQAHGFQGIASYSIAPAITVQTNFVGSWSCGLIPNDEITPTGTLYRVKERIPVQFGGAKEYLIQVLSTLGGGTHNVLGLITPNLVPVGGSYGAVTTGAPGEPGYIKVANIAARDALPPTDGRLVLTDDSNVIWVREGAAYIPVGLPVVTFANLTAYLPNPQQGWGYYQPSNDTQQGPRYRNTNGVWERPWNLPWGYRTQATPGVEVTSISNVVVDLNCNISFGVIKGRKYRISAKCPAKNTAGSSAFYMYLTDNANVVKESMDGILSATGFYEYFYLEEILDVVADATITRKLRGNINTGTTGAAGGNNAGRRAAIIVHDIGPSGGPV